MQIEYGSKSINPKTVACGTTVSVSCCKNDLKSRIQVVKRMKKYVIEYLTRGIFFNNLHETWAWTTSIT